MIICYVKSLNFSKNASRILLKFLEHIFHEFCSKLFDQNFPKKNLTLFPDTFQFSLFECPNILSAFLYRWDYTMQFI